MQPHSCHHQGNSNQATKTPVNPPPHIHPGLDGSLNTEHTIENAPTNRIKHLVLNTRYEVYKYIMTNISQVYDGQSVETLHWNSDQMFPILPGGVVKQKLRVVEVDTSRSRP